MDARNAGSQKWRQLAFLHWPVDIHALRPLVPAELELDLWNDVAYVGIVPFAMKEVRTNFMPRGLGFNFLEANLRTYVRHRGVAGVHFFSLDATSRLAVWGARATFGLPYFHADMEMSERDGELSYRVQRGHTAFSATYRPGQSLGTAQSGTVDAFLIERYFLFVKRRQHLWRAQVKHVPYPLCALEVERVDESLFGAAGLPPAQGSPAYAHFSPGVDVEVHAAERL